MFDKVSRPVATVYAVLTFFLFFFAGSFVYFFSLDGVVDRVPLTAAVGAPPASFWPDTDRDGLSDFDEIFVRFTNPAAVDSDYDGLADNEELTRGSQPLNPDSDADGWNDGEEISRATDPLTKNILSFDFISLGGRETRNQNGLAVTSNRASRGGRMGIIPMIELTFPNYRPAERDINMLEIAHRGFADWRRAGATAAAVIGNYQWLVDDNLSARGYQNKTIDDLKRMADPEGLPLILGIKLNSVLTNWRDFFAPPDPTSGFGKLADVINNVLAKTGDSRLVIDAETPFDWLARAYVAGEFQLTAADLAAFKANIALLNTSGRELIWWQPTFYATSQGNPYPRPTDSSNLLQARQYVYTEMFRALDEILGANFSTLTRAGADYYIDGNAKRGVPYQSSAINSFSALANHTSANSLSFIYSHRPYMYRAYAADAVRRGRGPAELVTDLSYLFGRDLHNAAFLRLPFDEVFVYPGVNQFDLIGLAMRQYLEQGIHISLLPDKYDGVLAGEPMTAVFESTTGKAFDVSFEVFAGCEPGAGVACAPISWSDAADQPWLVTEPSGRRAAFQWLPSRARAAGGGNHWLVFKFTNRDTGQVFSYPLAIIVKDTTDNVPPSPPASVQVGRNSAGEIVISWAPASDNLGVAGYEIFRDGLKLGEISPSRLSYEDTNVLSGAATYEIRAYDSARNFSPPAIGQGTGLPPDSGTALRIISSAPPSGAIDARQPSEINDPTPVGWQTIDLTFSSPLTSVAPADFIVLSSAGAAPGIREAFKDATKVTLNFDRPIPVGARTAIAHRPSRSSVCLGYLPGDVNASGATNAQDVPTLINSLNQVETRPIWSTDINRSGALNAQDITRFNDLLNGAAVFDPWLNKSLPACPTPDYQAAPVDSGDNGAGGSPDNGSGGSSGGGGHRRSSGGRVVNLNASSTDPAIIALKTRIFELQKLIIVLLQNLIRVLSARLGTITPH